MKKNIYKLYAFAALLTLSACSSDEAVDTVDTANVDKTLVAMTFTASQEGEGSTRTYVNEVDNANNKTRVYWSGQDKISVFDVKGSVGKCFELSSGGGSKNGVFSGTASDEAEKYTAVYPYTEGAVLNNDGSVSNVVLPSTQTATAGSFDPNAALMMAESTTENKNSLSFKNVIGLVKVKPEFACSKIIIRPSDKTAVLAGKGKLIYNGGEPTIDFSGSDEKSYIITLEGNIEANKDYYIAVPAATLNEKWSITFVSSDDKVYIRQSDRSITFERKKVIDLGTFTEDGTYWVSGESGIVEPSQEIDLGLQIQIDGNNYKVIFAKSNLTALGLAENETDFGDYFAWGATEPWLTDYTRAADGSVTSPIWKSSQYNTYDWATVPYRNGTNNNCDKYTVDGVQLDVNKDDAARLILGGNWQIPTKEIWSKLIESNQTLVNWGNSGNKTYDTIDGIKGLKISKCEYDETYIFLPAASDIYQTKCFQPGTYTNYWSSNAKSEVAAYNLGCLNDGIVTNYIHWRSYGLPIRPIRLVEVQ